MMLICCAVMMGGAFWAAKSGASLGWLVMLACPLMHLLIMRGHGSHDGSCHEEKKPAGGAEKI